MLSLVNVVVGAGSPRYLRNSVRSINLHSPHPTVVIYNFISSDHKKLVGDWLSQERDAGRIKDFHLNPNSGRHSKTGALYEAYNLALDRVVPDFDYVNFIQSDMQMLWWDEQILGFADSVCHRGDQLKVMCVTSQLPSRGVNSNFHLRFPVDSRSGLRFDLEQNAISDVGVFSTRWISKTGFRFFGSETSASRKQWEEGFRLVMGKPFVGAIPFPSHVRTGKERRGLGEKETAGNLILSLRREKPIAVEDEQEFWLEDYIHLTGSWAPFPFWLTDFSSLEWISRRKNAVRSLGIGFFSFIDRSGRVVSRRLPTRISLRLLTWLSRAFFGYAARTLGQLLGKMRNSLTA